MGADFIASALWRRGTSLAISEEEFTGIRDRIASLTPEQLAERLKDRWDMWESGDLEGPWSDDPEPGEPDKGQVAAALRKELDGDVDFLNEALGNKRRDVGGLQVGPYIVLLMGEMSWGDVDEGQESMWRLADSRVLEPLGFQRQGYMGSVQTDSYGTVMSAIFEVIADRRDCKVEEVVAAANKAQLYEDRIWEQVIGPAVDSIEDIMHDSLPEYA